MIDKNDSPQRTSKRAQSLIEYSLIIIVVMAGILTMGPYVIRSINSYFKFTEDSVEDSFLEEIEQAPPTEEEFPTCECGPVEWNCAVGIICPATQERGSRTCTPLGCDTFAGTCQDNPEVRWGTHKCCTSFVNIACDNDPETLTQSEITNAGGIYIDDYDQDGTSDWNPDTGKCLLEYMQQVHDCGSPASIKEYVCVYDIISCFLVCKGRDNFSEWCDGYQENLTEDNQAITYVNQGECTGAPCEAYCTGDLVAKSDGAYCGCPDIYIDFLQKDGNRCYCPEGWFRQGECSAGSCDQTREAGACTETGECSTDW